MLAQQDDDFSSGTLIFMLMMRAHQSLKRLIYRISKEQDESAVLLCDISLQGSYELLISYIYRLEQIYMSSHWPDGRLKDRLPLRRLFMPNF